MQFMFLPMLIDFPYMKSIFKNGFPTHAIHFSAYANRFPVHEIHLLIMLSENMK